MVAWAKNYIGIPFVSNGRTREGCDCYGLCRLVLQEEYHAVLPALSGDYENALDVKETAALFAENRPVLLAAPLSEPEEGCVVIITERGRPCHLGIYAGSGYILHTTAKTGSVAQRISHPDLAGRIEGYYRVR
ncbi:MAG: C40 family peptidase [Treponema sp.]|jgi:cell wall-associated NlpC family hydrolase|nr:C40 family peptidase [Treponema sp.]